MGSFNSKVQKLGHKNPNPNHQNPPKPTKMTWEAVFKFFDDDNSGNLSLAELKGKAAALGASGEHLESVFKAADKDGSGNISPAELKAACKKDCAALVAAADKDGDGEISLKEFTDAIAAKPKEFLPVLFSI